VKIPYMLKKHLAGFGFSVKGDDGVVRMIAIGGGQTSAQGELVDSPREDLTMDELRLIAGHAGFVREVEMGRIVMSPAQLREAGYEGQIPDSPMDVRLGGGSAIGELEKKILARDSELAAKTAELEALRAGQSEASHRVDELQAQQAQNQAFMATMMRQMESMAARLESIGQAPEAKPDADPEAKAGSKPDAKHKS